MHELLRKRRYTAGTPASPVTVDGTGKKLTFAPVVPTDVYRWGFLLTTTFDAGSFAAELNKQSPVGGSDVQQQTLDTVVDHAVGTVVYADLVLPVAEADGDDTLAGGVTPQTSRINKGPNGPLRVNPGESIDIEVTTAATTGDGVAFIEVVEHDWDANAATVGVVDAGN